MLGLPVDAKEHRFLHGFTRQLNVVLARSAADAGLYYLSEMETVLERNRLRICDQSAGRVGVNFFGLNAVDGLLEERVNPLNWLHNSLHPNERGHRVMSDTLVRWLAARPTLPPRPDPGRDAGPPATATTVQQILGDPDVRTCSNPRSGLAHCESTAGAWQSAQVVAVLGRSWAPLLLVVAGSWALWLLTIWSWRRWVAPPVEKAVDTAMVSTLRLPPG